MVRDEVMKSFVKGSAKHQTVSFCTRHTMLRVSQVYEDSAAGHRKSPRHAKVVADQFERGVTPLACRLRPTYPGGAHVPDRDC